MGDIFSSFFGGGFGGGRRHRADVGEDIEIRMKISLEDAIRGVTRKVEFERNISCETCHGKGGDTETCSHCNGSGQVRERMQTVFGVMEQTRTCGECHGTGEKIVHECVTCHGSGKISEKAEKVVEIPRGIEDGMSVKIRDEGHRGRDGNGDLYITFSVPNEEGGLTRQGTNLHYNVEISPAEAALGTKRTIVIPILGKKELNIRAGTQPNEEIIFKGEGLQSLEYHSKAGNLIVHLVVDIPKRLTADQKKLYEALLIAEGGKPKKGWLEELFG